MSGQPTLKRALSLPVITFYGLGTIIGAGIYVLVGEVAGKAGMLAPLAFVVAAGIAALTAFSYAELSARYPRSAGEAVYVHSAFGRRWLTAATGWAVVLTGLVSAATITRGFHGYLDLFVTVPPWLAISGCALCLGLIASWGINESAWTITAITALELLGLCLVLFWAGDSLGDLPVRWREMIPGATYDVWVALSAGSFLAFYAFIGFEDMVNVAEEVKNPSRNLPIAIFIALIISTCLYVLIALVAVLSLPLAQLAASAAPLADIVTQRGQISRNMIGGLSLFAVINGALVQVIMASRVLYGLSQQAMAPASFSSINPRTRTPVYATLFVTGIVLALALWLPLVTLAEMTSFVLLTIFALVNAALVWLKLKGPSPAGSVSYPIWIPVAGTVVCVAFVLVNIGLELLF